MAEEYVDDNFLIAVVSVVAIIVVGWLAYMVCFVAPDNNGERGVQRNKDRLEACTKGETATSADIAVCVKALEAK